MIYNIIDSRTRRYRWKNIDAIIEAAAHDNSVADADQHPEGTDDLAYESRKGVSVAEANAWATAKQCPVTLYLDDEGSNNA